MTSNVQRAAFRASTSLIMFAISVLTYGRQAKAAQCSPAEWLECSAQCRSLCNAVCSFKGPMWKCSYYGPLIATSCDSDAQGISCGCPDISTSTCKKFS